MIIIYLTKKEKTVKMKKIQVLEIQVYNYMIENKLNFNLKQWGVQIKFLKLMTNTFKDLHLPWH